MQGKLAEKNKERPQSLRKNKVSYYVDGFRKKVSFSKGPSALEFGEKDIHPSFEIKECPKDDLKAFIEFYKNHLNSSIIDDVKYSILMLYQSTQNERKEIFQEYFNYDLIHLLITTMVKYKSELALVVISFFNFIFFRKNA
ncbi:MAG: hypothetical protein MJ252_22830 [archaeon]|nr:hypothetical protein [archaeon]